MGNQSRQFREEDLKRPLVTGFSSSSGSSSPCNLDPSYSVICILKTFSPSPVLSTTTSFIKPPIIFPSTSLLADSIIKIPYGLVPYKLKAFNLRWGPGPHRSHSKLLSPYQYLSIVNRVYFMLFHGGGCNYQMRMPFISLSLISVVYPFNSTKHSVS